MFTTYQIKVLACPASQILFQILYIMKKLRLQRSYDDDVKQHGERGSTCHQEREQTGDILVDLYTICIGLILFVFVAPCVKKNMNRWVKRNHLCIFWAA